MLRTRVAVAIGGLLAGGLLPAGLLAGTASATTAGTAGGAVMRDVTASTASNTRECTYEYNADGVYIRAHPDGLPIPGEGFVGQLFFSYPYQAESAGGLTWIHGKDLSTGVTGWSAAEYLTLLGCRNT